MNKYILLLLILVSAIRTDASTLDSMLEKGPVLLVNKTSDDEFESVMSVTLINAPFEVVWDTVVNIEKYKSFMDRVLKSKVIEKNENDSVVTAEFEIDAPFFNVAYTLKYIVNINSKTIDVLQVKGDIEGSKWK